MIKSAIPVIIFFLLWAGFAADQSPAPKKDDGAVLFEKAEEYLNKKEFNLAIHCFEESSRKGFAKARFLLGNIYAYGWGGLIDYKLSSSWYRSYLSMAPQDTTLGRTHFNLGFMYLHGGNGLIKDEQEGLRWLKMAASEENSDAIELLNKLGIAEE
jgi:TPR repeat protein